MLASAPSDIANGALFPTTRVHLRVSCQRRPGGRNLVAMMNRLRRLAVPGVLPTLTSLALTLSPTAAQAHTGVDAPNRAAAQSAGDTRDPGHRASGRGAGASLDRGARPRARADRGALRRD
jgi:hypothetical protein